MIQIDMPMPMDCEACPLNDEYAECALLGELVVNCGRLPDCPLREVEDTMDESTREVERPERFTVETLAEHLKTVGSAIKTDADTIGHFADGGRSIKIEAEISPAEMATVVTYTVVRYADPRTRTANKVVDEVEE